MSKRFFKTAFLAAVLGLSLTPATQAGERMARLNPASTGSSISGLKWDQQDVKVELGEMTSKTELNATVVLEGVFLKKDWNIVWDKKILEPSPDDGRFTIKIQLTGETTTVLLNAFGPLGEKESETIELEFPIWNALLLSQVPSNSSKRMARLIPSETEEKLGQVRWKSLDLEVEINIDELTAHAIINGIYIRHDWNIVWERQIIEPGADGSFELKVQLTGETTPFELHAFGPLGESEAEPLKIVFPAWSTLSDLFKANSPKTSFFAPGIGFSFITFNDSRIRGFSEQVITGKFSYVRPIAPPNWDMGISSYVTLIPVHSSDPKRDARFFGMNLRVGYTFQHILEPWKFVVMGGWYYTTMFGPSHGFGFLNMGGPQIYPTLRRIFGSGNSISTYFKYSPVITGPGQISFKNRELALGGAYNMPWSKGHSVSLTLDLASFQLFIRNVAINSVSTTLGIGYGF